MLMAGEALAGIPYLICKYMSTAVLFMMKHEKTFSPICEKSIKVSEYIKLL